MKTITFFICALFSLQTWAQNLDTVYVRHLTLKSKDWAFAAGFFEETPKDSTGYSRFRKIRNAIIAANPSGYNVDVTIDSIPGRWVVRLYEEVRNSPAGLVEEIGVTIKNNIAAKTQVSYWTTRIDAVFSPLYLERRARGKNIILDTN